MTSSLCCANPRSLNPACGQGSVVDNFGGIKSYIFGSIDSKLAGILISDVYGFEAPNSRKFADEISAFTAILPVLKIPRDLFQFGSSQSHGFDKGFEEAKPVIATLKEKDVNSIGAAGYC